MSTRQISLRTRIDPKTLCPSCDSKGRAVKPVTIESLVIEAARARVGRTDGFRFCAEPSCEVAYFHPETGDRFLRRDVKVRIGQKETTPPRPVCYCFDHTVEEIEDEVARTGRSRIPDQIQEKCREGLDRCEETNPQGACCLGNVRRTLKEAQAQVNRGAPVDAVVTKESNETEEDCCAMNTKTLVCPTCGCSLVRLGVNRDQAPTTRWNDEEFRFCCRGCADLFVTDPRRFIRETNDLIVCPTCLAEKPQQFAVKVEVAGQEVHFCRCPYCVEAYRKDPDYYLKRLEGVIPYEGVLGHEGCCVRPG